MQAEGQKELVATQEKVIPCLCDVLVSVHECCWLSGGFIVNQHKIPEIVVPNLEGFEVSLILTLYTPYTQ